MKLTGILAVLTTLALPAAAQEMRTFTDSAGRSVEIPADPQRIVSLHDTSITLPLVELGLEPVGSQGRTRSDGTTYLRSVNEILGVDFDNSGIAFIGNWNQPDYEAIAALEPDLILALENCHDSHVDRLSAIAPVVLFPCSPEDGLAKIESIADAAGLSEAYEKNLATYRDRIERAKRFIPDADEISISFLQAQAYDGKLHVYAEYGAFTTVADDIGFARPAPVEEMRADDVREKIISPEIVQRHDADFIFDTYRIDRKDGPAALRARWEEMVPGYCAALHACREGQFVAIPREHASPQSFTTLGLNINYLVTHVAGRDFVPFEEE